MKGEGKFASNKQIFFWEIAMQTGSCIIVTRTNVTLVDGPLTRHCRLRLHKCNIKVILSPTYKFYYNRNDSLIDAFGPGRKHLVLFTLISMLKFVEPMIAEAPLNFFGTKKIFIMRKCQKYKTEHILTVKHSIRVYKESFLFLSKGRW